MGITGANQVVASTKEALLEAAGVLFAESGLEGASIRAIAKSGGVNIAAINYHFGSKENLYLEVIRHVLMKTRCPLASQLLSRRLEWCGDASKCSEVVYALAQERAHQYLPGVTPRWYGRLFIRLLLEPTPPIRALLEEIALPDLGRLEEVLLCCKPGMTRRESQMWVDSLVGQILHYVFTEDIVRLMPVRDVSGDFQQRVARHVALAVIKGLDLPVPAALLEPEAASGEVL